MVLLIVISGIVFSENKTALVVGNSDYQHFPKLSRPWQEAGLMKAALERLGFDVVYVVDGTYDQMYDALYTFERKLRQRGGIAFFHYGGHGIQVEGDNYLLPIDKNIPDERRVKSRAVKATEVVDLMAAAGSDTNIIVLDACRDNPLPTEAEWEYAARGGERADGYHVYAGSDRIENVAWYSDNSGGKTNPAGRKQANELGIYDMSGNVYEWCWDWFGDYPAGSVTDPSGPSSGSERVLRGGSWTISAKNCRSANRSHSPPARGGYFLGFRLVRLP